MTRRITAVLLVLIMTLTMIPAIAFAEGEVTDDSAPAKKAAQMDDQNQDGEGDQDQDGDQNQDGEGDQDQNKDGQTNNDQIRDKEKKTDSVVSLSRGTKILKKWGGTVTGINKDKATGTVKVPYGKSKIFYIKANKGFKISKIVVNGKKVAKKHKVLIKGNGNAQSIRVIFKKAGVSIMLDAGHAGHYNRGRIKRYYESVMTWRLTNYLKKELQSYGFICSMTKKSLRHDPGVYKRGKMAKGHDLFISIHSNWAPTGRADYPLAIVSSKHKKRLYKIAQPLGKKLVKKIRITMKTKQRYQVWVKRQRDGRDWYGVIRGAAKYNVPGIILEHSFHSNKSKCKWLLKRSNLKKMAAEEAKVIAHHYGYTK